MCGFRKPAEAVTHMRRRKEVCHPALCTLDGG